MHHQDGWMECNPLVLLRLVIIIVEYATVKEMEHSWDWHFENNIARKSLQITNVTLDRQGRQAAKQGFKWLLRRAKLYVARIEHISSAFTVSWLNSRWGAVCRSVWLLSYVNAYLIPLMLVSEHLLKCFTVLDGTCFRTYSRCGP